MQFQITTKIAQGLSAIDTAKAGLGKQKIDPVFAFGLRQKAAEKMGLDLAVLEKIRKKASREPALVIDEQFLFDLQSLVLGQEKQKDYCLTQVVKRMTSEAEEIIYTVSRENTLPALMHDFFAWLSSCAGSDPAQTHPVVVAGIAQRELLALHPFEDGNSKTALGLSYFLLSRSSFDFNGFLALPFCDNNKLLGIEKTYRYKPIDLTDFLEHFIGLLEKEVNDLMARFNQPIAPGLDDLWLQTEERSEELPAPLFSLAVAGLSERQNKIARFITQKGTITASLAAQVLRCPKRTAQLELQKMKNLKIITQKGKGPASFYELN